MSYIDKELMGTDQGREFALLVTREGGEDCVIFWLDENRPAHPFLRCDNQGLRRETIARALEVALVKLPQSDWPLLISVRFGCSIAELLDAATPNDVAAWEGPGRANPGRERGPMRETELTEPERAATSHKCRQCERIITEPADHKLDCGERGRKGTP